MQIIITGFEGCILVGGKTVRFRLPRHGCAAGGEISYLFLSRFGGQGSCGYLASRPDKIGKKACGKRPINNRLMIPPSSREI